LSVIDLTSSPDDRSGCRAFARAWQDSIGATSFLSMSSPEAGALLLRMANRLSDAMHSDQFDPGVGTEIGAGLVEAHFTDAETLGRTMIMFGTRLAADLAPCLPTVEAQRRVTALQGAFATGYARALWLRTLTEQDQIRKAVLVAQATAQEAMRASEARFRAVFAGAGVGIVIATVDGVIVEINQLMAEMIGGTVDGLTRTNIYDRADEQDAKTYRSLAMGERDHARVEKHYHRPDGSSFWADVTVSLIRDRDGTPRYTVTMTRDVTQRHLLSERLRYQSTHDPLTHLPNRSLFFEWLEELFARADPAGRVGLCYLDLDGFTMINDTLGHDAGDELLAAVAERLRTCASRLGHTVARIGGDEFILLASPTTNVAEMTELADAMLGALRAPIPINGHLITVSASVGIVERPIEGTTMAELMKAADVTLYWAKVDGKARRTVFDPERNARQIARYALSSAMPGALERGEFAVEYQPLVRLDTSSAIGAEALVRWRHPQLGRLAPDRFIDLAEETGLIVPLGSWVLREACQQAIRWQRMRPGEQSIVSVNLAARQARSPDIVDDVARILDETGLDPLLLQLELTESAVMGTPEEPFRALHQLSDMGIKITIDDFGTGYSNLAYLRRLPVHGLKLAGSFVEGLRTDTPDPVDARIVATLVDLAHTLGLSVTAEGVETSAQADRLRELGCDWAQGYYFARPAPEDSIIELLEGTGRRVAAAS
jgi:diguanylate cyclase (GGDEF)-like protein/PAS domain S-box-containing protein